MLQLAVTHMKPYGYLLQDVAVYPWLLFRNATNDSAVLTDSGFRLNPLKTTVYAGLPAAKTPKEEYLSAIMMVM